MSAEKEVMHLTHMLRYRGHKKAKITAKTVKQVTKYINQHVDSLNESDVTVEVLAHVAQRILGPPFLWAQTADLLGLLAHLERLRVATVEQAGMALAAIEQYSGSPSFHIKIPPDIEVDALRAMADNDTSSVRRSEYHHFKLQIRWMHLAKILISRDLPLFDETLLVYFPPLTDEEAWETKPYLDFLSPEEKQDEISRGNTLAELRVDSERWRTERETWWRLRFPNMLDEDLYGESPFFSYERDFLHRFRPAADLKELVEVVEKWILRVKVQIETLEEIFTPPEKRNGVLRLVLQPSSKTSRTLAAIPVSEQTSIASLRSSPLPKREPSSPPLPP